MIDDNGILHHGAHQPVRAAVADKQFDDLATGWNLTPDERATLRRELDEWRRIHPDQQ